MNWLSQILPKRLKQLVWGGDAYYCNLCNCSQRTFAARGHQYPIIQELSILGAGRRNVDCRICGSSDRDRLLWEYLQPIISAHPANSVLHVAPELPLANLLRSKTQIQYCAVDKRMRGYYYPSWVESADIQSGFPTQPDFFDIILCGHVLEHVESDLLALQQLIQKLKPAGKLVLSVPIAEKLPATRESNERDWLQLSSAEKIERFGQKDHRRLYGTDVLNRWQIGTKTPADNWHFFASQQSPNELKKQALNPKERLIIYANN